MLISTSDSVTTDPAEVWVDFAFLGDEFGTEARPFNTFAEAMSVVNTGGIINVKSGVTNESPTFNAPVTINAINGPVHVGDPGAATQAPGLEGAVIAGLIDTRSHGWFLTSFSLMTLATELRDAGATIIEIDTIDAEHLEGVDIFYGGYPEGTITLAEQAALVEFVEQGGGLVAVCMGGLAGGSTDSISSPFGVLTFAGNQGSLTTITELDHPVMDNRFGIVDNTSCRSSTK